MEDNKNMNGTNGTNVDAADIVDANGELKLNMRQYLYLLNAHAFHRTRVFRPEDRTDYVPEVGVADKLIAMGYGEAVERKEEPWFIPNEHAEQWLLDQRGRYRIPAYAVWDRTLFMQVYWHGTYRLALRDAAGYSNYQTVHYLTLLGLVSTTIEDDEFVLTLTEWGAQCARRWGVPCPSHLPEVQATQRMDADYGKEPEELKGVQYPEESCYAPDEQFTYNGPNWLRDTLQPTDPSTSWSAKREQYPGYGMEEMCFDDGWQQVDEFDRLQSEATWDEPWAPRPLEWYVAQFRAAWLRERQFLDEELMARQQIMGRDLTEAEYRKMRRELSDERDKERANDWDAQHDPFSNPWYYPYLLEKGYIEELGDDFRFLRRTKDMGLIQSSGPYKDVIEVVDFENYLNERESQKSES